VGGEGEVEGAKEEGEETEERYSVEACERQKVDPGEA